MTGVYANKTVPQGYDYLSDGQGGAQAVQRSTGEVVEAYTAIVPKGSLIYTPEDQERYHLRVQREAEAAAKKAERKLRRKAGDKYYFVRSDFGGDDLQPATKARLIFLATFIEYDTGRLMRTLRIPMRWEDLPEVMNISQSEVYRFRKEVAGSYIIDHGGALFAKDTAFFRGKFARNREGRYQQFFISAVRQLYRETPANRHKYLGYVFAMLPWVNLEYNILCHNPEEQNLANIEQITVSEFCELIGYSEKNKKRLLRIYKSITFLANGKNEYFCSFVTNGADIDTAQIFINPHILYKGSKAESVMILGKFCEVPS